MSDLSGIFIRVKMSEKENSGTDDNVYLGVEGTGGGREFRLNVDSFDDFERGEEVYYNLGGVSFTLLQAMVADGEIPNTAGFLVPEETFQGGLNDPAAVPIDFAQIDRVYLRKMGDRDGTEDNAMIVESIDVWLFSDEDVRRKFFCSSEFRLGSEYGLQLWLRPLRLL